MGEDFPKEFKEKYPHAYKWDQTIAERPSVKKCFQDRQKAMGK